MRKSDHIYNALEVDMCGLIVHDVVQTPNMTNTKLENG
jgi:hypothetical protein